MRIIYFLILTVSATSIVLLSHVAAGWEEMRECRDPAGNVLYRVRHTAMRGDEVVAPNNIVIGMIKNGEVRDSGNRVLARGGDAGLLYCLTRK